MPPATRAALVLAAGLTASVPAAAAEPARTLRADHFHTGGLGVEIFALDRVSVEPLKWRDLVAGGTPLPTPWPKAAFEGRQRDFQARRKQVRAGNRPEREMNDLFREEQACTTRLLGADRHARAVGAFQGANHDAEAYYRPQLDCVMFTRDEVPFCRVCQRALDEAIDLYAGLRRTE